MTKDAVHIDAAYGEFDQLTWTARLYRHLTRQLTLTVRRGDKLLLVAMPVYTNQLQATRTVIFSLNPYPQSCDTHPDLNEFLGIHWYFGHYGTRVEHAGPAWTFTCVLTSLLKSIENLYYSNC